MLPIVDFVGACSFRRRGFRADSAVVRALPLTAAIDAMRGNMLQGIAWGSFMIPVAILLAWFRGSVLRFPAHLPLEIEARAVGLRQRWDWEQIPQGLKPTIILWRLRRD